MTLRLKDISEFMDKYACQRSQFYYHI